MEVKRPTDSIVHGCVQGIIARHLHHQNSTDEWTERISVTHVASFTEHRCWVLHLASCTASGL